MHLQDALLLVIGDEFAFRWLGAFQRLADKLFQRHVVRDVAQAAANRRAERDAHDLRRGFVEADDAFVGVDGEHALGHTRQDSLLLVALVDHRADAVVELARHLVQRFRQARGFPGGGDGQLF